MPTIRSVSNIRSKLLHPALTSHFEVSIPYPPGLSANAKYWKDNNVILNQEKLNLMCSEASLPGSSLTTHEINNDFHGVTERHAYRRVYDDRIDLTFYVDAENYLPIRFFETWIKYAVGENVGTDGGRAGSKSSNYFYRVRYPKQYITEDGFSITKFERTGKNGVYSGPSLTYNFVNVFPIAVASMPVSYDASSLLKCSVSMSYIRYYIAGTKDKNPKENEATTGDPSNPFTQSISGSYRGEMPDYLTNPVFQASANDFNFAGGINGPLDQTQPVTNTNTNIGRTRGQVLGGF